MMTKRFLMKLTFVTVALSISLFLFANTTKASGISKENYIVVSVQNGDTLWSIVKSNCNNYRDIRKAVYYIKEANNLTTANITPGQQIKIPSELYK